MVLDNLVHVNYYQILIQLTLKRGMKILYVYYFFK